MVRRAPRSARRRPAPCAGRERRDRAPRPDSRARDWTSGASYRRARRASGSWRPSPCRGPAPGGGGRARDRACRRPRRRRRGSQSHPVVCSSVPPVAATCSHGASDTTGVLVAAGDKRGSASTLMAVSIPADARLLALEDVATQLRVDSVRATTAAGSGHPTSCASAADLVAAIFFDVMRVDPQAPRDPACDRFVLSKGHAAPLLYAAWAAVGALDRKDLVQLRQIDSDLEGHPTPRLPFVDVATGSLGQGLGVGVGLAVGARMLGTDARVFVLLGDGEMAEGSVWEAAQMASHEKVENLVAIVDVNALGQSGPTILGHDLKTYQRRLAAFGWRVNVIDGHDMKQITTALRRAIRGRGAPTAIVARTVKGKGLGAEVEGKEGWHGKPLPADMAERVIASLESHLHHLPPPPIRRPRGVGKTKLPPPQPIAGKPPLGEIATRQAYGEALVRVGESDARVRVLDGDVKNSTYAEKFKDRFPERFVEAYIAEQNMVSAAAGLAAQGLVP